MVFSGLLLMMRSSYSFSIRRVCRLTLAGLLFLAGCGDAFLNSTSSLGGDGAGSRGSVSVIIINNTSHSAALTVGTFDAGDPDFVPDATQIGLDDVGLTLGPDSQLDAIPFRCGRTFAVGSTTLLDLVEGAFDAEDIEVATFVAGVSFFDVDADVAVEPVLVGTSPAMEALLGLDFNCGSILIIRLEVDALTVDAFRVDFELIPSGSGR